MYENKIIAVTQQLRYRSADSPPIKVRHSRAKRAFDIAVTALLLVTVAPVLLAIALLVRRDGGPALIRHRRIGADGVAFDCYKFRSMVVDAESALETLLAANPTLRDEWARDFKLRDDPRITRLGRFLRRTSLDELPQLFNVLRGDMSLVGPRPIVDAEVPRYGSCFADYIACRPGITGLWQVTGRNDVSYDRRVELDASYARGWSVALDLRILLKTLVVVLRRDGAY
jgi:undecaprenyl-phosphate galactose phosphotransferase